MFLPRPTAWYVGMFEQMKRGFEQAGVEVFGGPKHLDPAELRDFCTSVRPDAVFEMNRTRSGAKGLAPHVRHAAWIVDLGHRSPERFHEFEGSDVTYFFSPIWFPYFPYRSLHGYLAPGADPEVYRAEPCEGRYAATFAGHIPLPWSSELLNREVVKGEGSLRFSQLLAQVEARMLQDARAKDSEPWNPLSYAQEYCRQHTGAELDEDPALRYDLGVRIGRTFRRRMMAELLVASSRKIGFFGTENWKQWESFAKFYVANLETPAQLHRLYTQSCITIHEGIGLHFRTMDAMASGGLVFCKRIPDDNAPEGISSTLVPGEEYIAFDWDDLHERMTEILDNPSRASAIRRRAQAKIRAAHTWKHRAQKVLQDLALAG